LNSGVYSDYSVKKIKRRLSAMQSAFEDATVTGYEHRISVLKANAKDLHVMAAAIECGATTIVTFNIKDFPPASVEPLDIEVLDPDEFLFRAWQTRPITLSRMLIRQADSRGVSVDRLLEELGRSTPRFVAGVRAQIRKGA
jgi:hypothetical protein